MPGLPKNIQFGRYAKLFLTNGAQALDLSNLRFKFLTQANDVETPNTAQVRVYNVKDETAKQAIAEYYGVIIDAGYQDNPGTIFRGTIKQFWRGREKNVDSFLDIYAADSDLAYNFGIVNDTVPAGSTNLQRLRILLEALSKAEGSLQQSETKTEEAIQKAVSQQITLDPNAASFLSTTGGILPRGKVLFGMARDYIRDLADSNGCRWSIQGGVLTLIPLTGYLPGQAVAINSATGQIGVPEATDQGVKVRCLINPKIRIGTTIRLNNKEITAATIKEQFFPGITNVNLIAKVSGDSDGLYRVLVIEHQGDTRDDPWWSDITCINVDPSSPADDSVLPYGIPQ